MKNIFKSIVAFVLTLTLVLLTVVPVFAATEPTSYSDSYNSGQRGVVCTSLEGTGAKDYYTASYTYDRLAELSESELISTLKGLMKSTHTYISSYDDCHYKADRTDCENGDGRVLLIYTSYSATMSQYNGWNREHVWPKSLGGRNTSGGGADLHHIRPSDAGVNGTRGNKKYGEVGSGATEKKGTKPAVGVLGGYYNSSYFEPLDCVKGDVARICLYVYVRWGSEWGATSITSVFQSVDVLLEWCELDPVDTWEMGRNEVVESIQGNRNVFIDYPELAWLIFGREVPEGMTTPSGNASGGNQGGSSDTNPDTGTDVTPDPSCNHTYTERRGQKAPDCSATGYTGDLYCLSCKAKVGEGEILPATKNHVWSDSEVKDPASVFGTGSNEAVCSECEVKGFILVPALTDSFIESIAGSEEEKILLALLKYAFDGMVLENIG